MRLQNLETQETPRIEIKDKFDEKVSNGTPDAAPNQRQDVAVQVQNDA